MAHAQYVFAGTSFFAAIVAISLFGRVLCCKRRRLLSRMEINNSEVESGDQPSIKKEMSGSSKQHSSGEVNGMTNGHGEHRSSSKSKDKDKHRHSSSSKHSSSSSSSKDKDRSDKDKHREKDKDRSKDKERSKSLSEKDKDRSKDKDRKHRDENKSKSEHKSSSSSSSKDHNKSSSSSSSKGESKEKDRSREKERSKDKSDRHNSSSSSDKKHKDGEHRSKDKSSSSSSSKDKERSDKEKSKSKEIQVKTEPIKVKPEPIDEDMPLAQVTPVAKKVKSEPESDEEDDRPLLAKQQERASHRMERSNTSIQKRKAVSATEEDSDSDVPLMQRKKVKKESKKRAKREESDEEEDFKPAKKPKQKGKKKEEVTESPKKGGRKKKEEEKTEVWKWWEEDKPSDGTKWKYLEHKGPVFAAPYVRMPDKVKFKYNGKSMKLSEAAEEVATFYAKMLEHDYGTKATFNENFFKDWRKLMTNEERASITDLTKCDFRDMHAYFKEVSEERKARSKEEKKKELEANAELAKEYGTCTIDGHSEKIGNFKIEPPGLFRGRGEHPKMGKLKRRVMPEDVIINCSKDAPAPKAPAGHRWKEVRHDPNVTWLASWTENVQNQVKYVMLNPSSKLKGEKDMQKYETARKLHKKIDKIREEYRNDWRNKEMRIRQRSVALYFIDRLALRAGNEKDEEQADTVGCCSLRVEHIELHAEKDGKPCVVVFDFLGKDSIRYYNEVPVEKRVFKNLQLFMENKNTGDDLFDRLNTSILNKHLNDLMEGLTAKVFRTYNASITLQQQLDELTDGDANLPEKLLAYNRANRAVAILCNHQRSVPKTHAKSMEALKAKIDAKREQMEDAQAEYESAKRELKRSKSAKDKIDLEKKKKAFERHTQAFQKLELTATDREENKEIALGTSKLNYLDPRISVAWCKKHDVPIDKVYNKTQREKFRWAVDMATADYVF